MKSINWNSATGRIPINAAPHAAPTIAPSEIGVSTTYALPNWSINPSVTLNAPPYAPTSSPITNTVGSRSISSQIPWRIASTIVACPPRSGRADLCSFLTAVDILDTQADLSNFPLRIVRRLRVYYKPLPLWVYEHIESLHRIGT